MSVVSSLSPYVFDLQRQFFSLPHVFSITILQNSISQFTLSFVLNSPLFDLSLRALYPTGLILTGKAILVCGVLVGPAGERLEGIFRKVKVSIAKQKTTTNGLFK